MSIFDGIILGIIQGLSEFLPISSSGHLVIAEALLGVKQSGVQFEVLVHLATLLAVVVYFRAKLITIATGFFRPDGKMERNYVWCLAIGTIPAVFAGLLLKDFFEAKFGDPLTTSCMLIVTGGILFATRLVSKGTGGITLGKSLLIGIGQAVAILPGISRSGSTIATGLFTGIKPAEAAEFSFLLSIPVILGAAVLELRHLTSIPADLVVPYLAAAVCAFAFGLLAVHLVLEAVRKAKLIYFAIYCVAAGLLGIYLFW